MRVDKNYTKYATVHVEKILQNEIWEKNIKINKLIGIFYFRDTLVTENQNFLTDISA